MNGQSPGTSLWKCQSFLIAIKQDRALGIAALLVATLAPTSDFSIARSVRWREPDSLLTLWTLEARSQWLSISVLMGRELYLVIGRPFPRYRSSCRATGSHWSGVNYSSLSIRVRYVWTLPALRTQVYGLVVSLHIYFISISLRRRKYFSTLSPLWEVGCKAGQ